MDKFNKLLHFMFFCHRIPNRSFFYKGKQFPLCARCTGILIGYFVGIAYLIIFKNFSLPFLLILLLPLLIDGIGQYVGFWVSTNTRRFITGILAGIATICLIQFAAIQGYYDGIELGKKIIKN